MNQYDEMTEQEEAEFQDKQEYEDDIRLTVLYEQLTEMQSRICRERFRTREERQEILDVVQAFIQMMIHFDKNHEKRKGQYYNDGRACSRPDSL